MKGIERRRDEWVAKAAALDPRYRDDYPGLWGIWSRAQAGRGGGLVRTPDSQFGPGLCASPRGRADVTAPTRGRGDRLCGRTQAGRLATAQTTPSHRKSRGSLSGICRASLREESRGCVGHQQDATPPPPRTGRLGQPPPDSDHETGGPWSLRELVRYGPRRAPGTIRAMSRHTGSTAKDPERQRLGRLGALSGHARGKTNTAPARAAWEAALAAEFGMTSD